MFYKTCQKSSDILARSLDDSKEDVLNTSTVQIQIDQSDQAKSFIKQLYESDDSDIDPNDDFIFEAVSEEVNEQQIHYD